MNAKLERIAIAAAVTALGACSSAYPPRDLSTQNQITEQLAKAAAPTAKAGSVPDSVSSSLLPALKAPMPKASGKQLEPRFDLVVSDAPIGQVLNGIVADTRYSIVLKPKSEMAMLPTAGAPASTASTLPDRVTLNLKDVTVFEALDAIRDVYGYDYTVEGTRIYVQQPELQTRVYQVNYILGQRRGVSDLQVIGGASVGSSSSGSSSGSGGGGSSSGSGSNSNYASIQASALSTISKSDLWGEVEDSLRTLLGCQIPRKQAEKTTSGSGGGSSGGGGSGGSSNNNSSSGASRADVSFVGDAATAERSRGVDGCPEGRAIAINQMSGTILVRGMPKDLRQVEAILRSMQLSIERQVIIEAKIIDVELNSESQQGINWAAFTRGTHRMSVGANTTSITEPGSTFGSYGGTTLVSQNGTTVTTGPTGTTTSETFSAPSMADVLGTGLLGTSANTAFNAGLGVAVQFRNFSALINFLQTQGTVHVLSSPRIATLNNQKAVLKVGSEEPFVTNISGGTATTSAAGTVVTPATLLYQPFFSGISLDVTPQIDERENITLHVHALVNSIVEKEKISLPSANAALVPFAVNTINEADSVVKSRDGQVIVIGGLMTQSNADNRDKVPGAGDVPGFGALFRKGNQRATKRELVILLKPTVVKDDSAWTNDIAETQGRIEALGSK